MAKQVPGAAFRQAPPLPSTSDMAAFVARAAAPPLVVVPNEPVSSALPNEVQVTPATPAAPERSSEGSEPAAAVNLVADPPPPAIGSAPSAAAPNRATRAAAAELVTTRTATIRVPTAPAGEGAWRSKTVKRVDGRELRKQTVYLDAALSHRLTMHCAKYHYEQSKAVEHAILALLEACGD